MWRENRENKGNWKVRRKQKRGGGGDSKSIWETPEGGGGIWREQEDGRGGWQELEDERGLRGRWRGIPLRIEWPIGAEGSSVIRNQTVTKFVHSSSSVYFAFLCLFSFPCLSSPLSLDLNFFHAPVFLLLSFFISYFMLSQLFTIHWGTNF